MTVGMPADAHADAASGAARPLAPSRLDERVLAAGTTLRFALLLLLLTAAGANMVPRVVRHLLASPELADKAWACWMAAGIDATGSLNAGYVEYAHNVAPLEACTAQYEQDFDGVSLAVGAAALAVAFAVYWLLPVWRTRSSKVAAVDVMDVHGGLRPLLDELVAVAGLTRPPRFVVDPAAVSTAGAVAFGRLRAPTVRLDGGLVALCDTQRDRFRAVVLHELAHLRNGDTTVTYATVALWRVFLALVLLPWAAVSVDILFIAGTPEVRGQFAPFNAHDLALAALLVLAIHLARAGILRNREIYADLMAARWGASAEPWEVPSREPSGAWSRLLGGFLELWRTHPSWALRRASLTDPKALFVLERLPLFLTGLAADVLVWHLGSVSNSALPVKAVLVAGLAVGIAGVALWRAVLYALLAGRRPPSGAPVGLWLGLGLVVGELVGPGSAYNHWLPAHPEALLILVAALVLVMTWTAHNAEWWLGTWRGRSPAPAVLVGLAAPALVLASVLYWWYAEGRALTDGWPYTTAGLLGSYGLPGLPPPDIGPLLDVVAVVGVLPGTDASVDSFWWAGVLLWTVPLLASVARPPSRAPKWLARALPGRAEPLAPNRARPGRLLAAGLAGAVVCWAGLALALSHLHTPDPAAVRMTGPFQLEHLMWPVLVICGAMALTAAVVAAVTRTVWLPAGLVAAGVTGLLGAGATFLLMAADGCLGPLDTMTSTCGWLPGAAGPLVRTELAYVLCLGTLLAGLAAFVGRGAGLLARATRRTRTPTALNQRTHQSRRRVVPVAAVAVVAASVGAALLATQAAGPATRSARPSEAMLDQSVATPSAELTRLEGKAWAAVGGLDHLNAFMAAERDYTAAVRVAGESASDTEFRAAIRELGPRCTALARTAARAAAYFRVPEPTGQQMWTSVLTRHRQLATACRDLTARPGAGTAEIATTARQSAVDSTDAMLYWLAETGAIRQRPS
ncbi:M48 family metalloprotease [Streptomyces sp. NPDC051684]|uniref:M48 family metalloprotease n=1 Tax=Streptomyces sp. NPDC051684 TaxID=3365670 RepID=UPI003794E176